MERKAPQLPLIRYEVQAGELRPKARILVLEVPLGTVPRNRAIRKLSRQVGLKELAARFGLSIPQIWRIIRGLTSGRGRAGKRRGKTRR
jgi:hypothetical protein